MKKIILSVVCLLVVGALTFNFVTADEKTSVGGYKVGDAVKDFTIVNTDGVTYDLSKNGGKATVVMFWSTQCPFVQPYTERINELAKNYTDQGIVFWGINSNKTEDAGSVASHKEEKGYPFPMLKDLNNVVADQFGAERTPEVYVIDNASMQVIYHGSIDDNKDASSVTATYLKNALDQFLAGNAITTAETKSFGCTIKR
ncbi:MAG TPA: thioredoxin family protein [Ignavibacteria bacterium]|nr:thioredoxin family protein [Ignavibacteria bacterium]